MVNQYWREDKYTEKEPPVKKRDNKQEKNPWKGGKKGKK
jgi:hypothetical protein